MGAGYRIVVADDEPVTRLDIVEILREAGHEILGEAADGFDAIEQCRLHQPDLVLLDIKMPLLDGLKAARIIHKEQLATAVVLLTAYSGEEFVEEAKEAGVLGYIVKPIREESVLPVIGIAVEKGREISSMSKEVEKTRQRLEDRAIIEKAKGVLMREQNLGEEEAFQLIRRIGMDKRKPMREIAEIILVNGK